MLKPYYLRIWFLAFITLLSTSQCGKQRRFHFVTYDGVVISDNTGQPAPGVQVTSDGCGGQFALGGWDPSCDDRRFNVGKATTDATGHFHIREHAARTDLYFVSTHNPVTNLGSDRDRDGASAEGLKADKYAVLHTR